MIREGSFAKQWPTTFPSGQGSDLAGVVEEVGSAVKNAAVGDEVIGFTDQFVKCRFVRKFWITPFVVKDHVVLVSA
jgi:NADPH:quinone reductase-like Zn-dependent oxidoreductase